MESPGREEQVPLPGETWDACQYAKEVSDEGDCPDSQVIWKAPSFFPGVLGSNIRLLQVETTVPLCCGLISQNTIGFGDVQGHLMRKKS